jgi:hypothetical protein
MLRRRTWLCQLKNWYTYEGSLNLEKRKMLRRVRQQAFWALTSGSRSKAPTCLKNKTFDDIPFKAFVTFISKLFMTFLSKLFMTYYFQSFR